MSQLRNKIAALKYGERLTSPPTVVAFNEAIDKILALPELKSAIEKAEKYDKLFEKLQVAMKCGCTETITSAKVFCKLCNGTGKISRELTEMEKEEIFEYIVERERRIIIGSYLDSSDFKMQIVEVKK